MSAADFVATDTTDLLLERLGRHGEWKHLGSPLLVLALLEHPTQMILIQTRCARRMHSELLVESAYRNGALFWHDVQTPKRLRKLIASSERDIRRAWKLRAAEREGLSYEQALIILERGP